MLRRTGVPSQIFKRLNHHIVFKPNPEKAKAYASFQKHTEEHAVSTTRLWRNLSIGTVPIILACAWYVYPKETHHIAHLEHLVSLPDDEWPPEMEYQNIRTRKFFWGDGDHSPFWGPTNHHKKN